MNRAFDLLRQARLRALLFRGLANAADVWRAYRSGAVIPPLRFRDGVILHHCAGDAPVFLFFEVFANGCYRRRLAPAGLGTILDIGANIGAFTIDCARRFPAVTIDAYEPNPAACEVLRRNVDANRLGDRVRIYPEAVGRQCGVLTLWGSDASLSGSAHPTGSGANGPAVQCRMIDLETAFARARGDVEVVKIDAEGAEADILEGGRAVVARAAEYVGEFHEDRVPGVLERCRVVLGDAGFAFASSRTRRCGPQFHARRGR
jgi:FkbM family methyltransferase